MLSSVTKWLVTALKIVDGFFGLLKGILTKQQAGHKQIYIGHLRDIIFSILRAKKL